MEEDAMAAQENRVVVINCIVVGVRGQSISISTKLSARVETLSELIKEAYNPELKDVGRQCELLLFEAKKADGTWLSADPAFKETEKEMATGKTPKEIKRIISNKRNLLNGRLSIAQAFGEAIPTSEYLHVLVKTPLLATEPITATAPSEYNDSLQVSRKRGADAMAEDDITMEDVAMAVPDVVEVNCFVIGHGDVAGIRIAPNAKLATVKEKIVEEFPELKKIGKGNLKLFPAKKAGGTWLSADPAFKDIEQAMLRGVVPDEIIATAVFWDVKQLQTLSVKIYHQEGTIKETKNSAVFKYRRIAADLKTSKRVEDVVKTLEDVRNGVEDPMRFVVLENSSGTGKTQMAFNLEANGAFEVFYLPCTTLKDSRQRVYEPFKSRQLAFVSCMKNDIDSLDTTNDGRYEFDGSVSDFDGTDKKPLSVYAFIIAALSGAGTCIGNAVRKDVAEARDRRIRDKKQPMLFFLDEFPRVQDDNPKLVRSMRNVFRSLRLPLILSATNGTARNLYTGSDSSRVARVPWCTVIPSLPKFATGRTTSVFEWIISNSRPLFGASAQKHMTQFPYDGQDRLKYLTNMVKALTPEFRSLKRAEEFERGQLYLFLGTSYNAYVGDKSKKRKDLYRDRKEVNLIDGHYGRMEEQKIFELQLGTQKELVKNDKVWECRCVFPRIEDDILLYLTLMGDYEDSDAYSSGHHRQQAVPNNKWSPLDLPFWKKLRTALNQNRTATSNPAQVTNDGMDLEALAVGAVILASHQGGFYGTDFETFFGRLLYELGVRDVIRTVTFPQGHTVNFKVPFLSPPNVAWPGEFLEKIPEAEFANMERTPNSKMIDFTAHGGTLTGECKDRQQFPLEVLKSVLKAIPSTTKVHLVVANNLQERYFTMASKSESANSCCNSAAEPKDAASAAASKSKERKEGQKTTVRKKKTEEGQEKKIEAGREKKKTEAIAGQKKKTEAGQERKAKTQRNCETASEFLKRIKLQHAKFYRIATKGRFKEFSELMEARQDLPGDETSSSAGGAGKTIIFIEVGDWKKK